MKMTFKTIFISYLCFSNFFQNLNGEQEIWKNVDFEVISTGDCDLHLIINGFGQNFDLLLEYPEESVFSDDFEVKDSLGHTLYTLPPLDDFINTFEKSKHIMIDKLTSSVLKFDNTSQDWKEWKITGIVGEYYRIFYNHESNAHYMVKLDLNDYANLSDYVQVPDIQSSLKKISKRSVITTRNNVIMQIRPGLLIVVDFKNFALGLKNDKLVEYLAIFLNGINNRFATIKSIDIKFRLVGVTSIQSQIQQDFIEKNRLRSGTNGNKVLEDFSTWCYKNVKISYDLTMLLTAEKLFPTFDRQLNVNQPVFGLAYFSEPCLRDRARQITYGSNLVYDPGALWSGVWTAVHELAHNLGAPHDGQEINGSGNCPQSDGFLMSDEGFGEVTKFFFSPCSIQLMTNLIQSDKGQCLRKRASQTSFSSEQNVGDKFSLGTQCQIYSFNRNAVTTSKDFQSCEIPQDDYCIKLHCQNNAGGNVKNFTIPVATADNTPCGRYNERCWNGKCVLPDYSPCGDFQEYYLNGDCIVPEIELSEGFQKLGRVGEKAYYFYRKDEIAWLDGVNRCYANGFEPASMEIPEEQVFLYEKTRDLEPYWTGGAGRMNEHEEQDLYWAKNGQELTVEGGHWAWAPGPGKGCLLVITSTYWYYYPGCDHTRPEPGSGRWMTRNENTTFGMLCERIEDSSALCRRGFKKYHINPDPDKITTFALVKQRDASNYCKSKGMSLLSITSASEWIDVQNFVESVEKYAGQTHMYSWTSGRKSDDDGTWRWANQESVNFSNFQYNIDNTLDPEELKNLNGLMLMWDFNSKTTFIMDFNKDMDSPLFNYYTICEYY